MTIRFETLNLTYPDQKGIPQIRRNLKNRNGRYICSQCGELYEDRLPEVLDRAKEHDLIHPDADIVIRGDICGMSLF